MAVFKRGGVWKVVLDEDLGVGLQASRDPGTLLDSLRPRRVKVRIAGEDRGPYAHDVVAPEPPGINRRPQDNLVEHGQGDDADTLSQLFLDHPGESARRSTPSSLGHWSLPQLDLVVRLGRVNARADDAVCDRFASDQVGGNDLVPHRRLVRDLVGQADQQHVAN